MQLTCIPARTSRLLSPARASPGALSEVQSPQGARAQERLGRGDTDLKVVLHREVHDSPEALRFRNLTVGFPPPELP